MLKWIWKHRFDIMMATGAILVLSGCVAGLAESHTEALALIFSGVNLTIFSALLWQGGNFFL